MTANITTAITLAESGLILAADIIIDDKNVSKNKTINPIITPKTADIKKLFFCSPLNFIIKTPSHRLYETVFMFILIL